MSMLSGNRSHASRNAVRNNDGDNAVTGMDDNNEGAGDEGNANGNENVDANNESS